MTDLVFERLKASVLAYLDAGSSTTDEEIEGVLQVFRGLPDVDDEMLDRLRRYIEEQVIVTSAEATTLESKDHVPWLKARAADFEWQFWERYKRHLLEQKGLPAAVIDRVDETTDTILDHLEDPAIHNAWDRRGLVVGQVQSGKTANYLGLIAKAIDVGYRVIIVLAGADNDLRAQTQIRLEEGLIGWNTSGRRVDATGRAKTVGVGHLRPGLDMSLNPQTTREQDGDFKAAPASVMKAIGTDPLILVVKKNRSVLQNVLRYLTSVSAEANDDDQPRIRTHPLLLVDDEADHFSVNTADPETDPTTINGLVRKILACFEKSAYVGYTATAFANIFIALDDESDGFGDTLFPRDFIVNIHPPSNYVGAQRVFGLTDKALGVDAKPLPIVRHCDDSEDWLPSKHKNFADPGEFLPQSLEDALDSFLITIAIRRVRGQRQAHNSMLVHVTRFNSVQERVRQLIDGRVRRIRTRLRQGDDGDTFARLRRVFEDDYVPTTMQMAEAREFGRLELPTWDQVAGELRAAVESLEIRTINGLAKEVLDYSDRAEAGLNVVAIGGNKLSRGLTLEGLSVSYYLRTSRAYDTLLQMGRWFGFRQGYADLCRLYTTRQLQDWYRDITLANAELLVQLDRMSDENATPREFGLRVRTNTDGLLVSSPNKIRATKRITLSFSNQTREQVAYPRDPSKKQRSLAAFEKLLTAISDHEQAADDGTSSAGSRLIFVDVPGEHVLEFLRRYPTNPEARLTRTDLMADYVEDRLQHGELSRWRVVVLNPTTRSGAGGERRSWPVGDRSVGLSERASDTRAVGPGEPEPTTDAEQYRVDRVLGSEDQVEGLTDEEVQRAKDLLAAKPHLKASDAYRAQRDYGLLFLALLDPARANKAVPLDSDSGKAAEPYVGLTVVFPPSRAPAAGREYMINEVYDQMQLGWDDRE